MCAPAKCQQLVFPFERLVKLLLRIVEHPPISAENIDLPPPRVVALDNSRLLELLLWQTDVPQRRAFGEAGGVRVALALIEQCLNDSANQFNEAFLLFKCWSVLYNAVLFVHQNSKLFIDLSGLEMFVYCVRKWPDQEKLCCILLLLIENMAYYKRLRGYLKRDELIALFRELLDMSPEYNCISFYAAEVLSLLLADGESLWYFYADCDDYSALLPVALTHSPAAIAEQIAAAVERWDSNVCWNIGGTSFLPLISLIAAFESFASQYFAVWALNNLTLFHLDKFVRSSYV